MFLSFLDDTPSSSFYVNANYEECSSDAGDGGNSIFIKSNDFGLLIMDNIIDDPLNSSLYYGQLTHTESVPFSLFGFRNPSASTVYVYAEEGASDTDDCSATPCRSLAHAYALLRHDEEITIFLKANPSLSQSLSIRSTNSIATFQGFGPDTTTVTVSNEARFHVEGHLWLDTMNIESSTILMNSLVYAPASAEAAKIYAGNCNFTIQMGYSAIFVIESATSFEMQSCIFPSYARFSEGPAVLDLTSKKDMKVSLNDTSLTTNSSSPHSPLAIVVQSAKNVIFSDVDFQVNLTFSDSDSQPYFILKGSFVEGDVEKVFKGVLDQEADDSAKYWGIRSGDSRPLKAILAGNQTKLVDVVFVSQPAGSGETGTMDDPIGTLQTAFEKFPNIIYVKSNIDADVGEIMTDSPLSVIGLNDTVPPQITGTLHIHFETPLVLKNLAFPTAGLTFSAYGDELVLDSCIFGTLNTILNPSAQLFTDSTDLESFTVKGCSFSSLSVGSSILEFTVSHTYEAIIGHPQMKTVFQHISGGVCLDVDVVDGTFLLQHTHFVECSAAQDGNGAALNLFIQYGEATIKACLFHRNRANLGGALFIDTNGFDNAQMTLVISDGDDPLHTPLKFIDCSAQSGNNIYIVSTQYVLDNDTLAFDPTPMKSNDYILVIRCHHANESKPKQIFITDTSTWTEPISLSKSNGLYSIQRSGTDVTSLRLSNEKYETEHGVDPPRGFISLDTTIRILMLTICIPQQTFPSPFIFVASEGNLELSSVAVTAMQSTAPTSFGYSSFIHSEGIFKLTGTSTVSELLNFGDKTAFVIVGKSFSFECHSDPGKRGRVASRSTTATDIFEISVQYENTVFINHIDFVGSANGVSHRVLTGKSEMTLELLNCSFTHFTKLPGLSEDEDGGVLYFHKKVHLTLIRCSFSSISSNGRGGVIFAQDLYSFNVTDSSFDICSSGGNGGCLHIAYPDTSSGAAFVFQATFQECSCGSGKNGSWAHFTEMPASPQLVPDNWPITDNSMTRDSTNHFTATVTTSGVESTIDLIDFLFPPQLETVYVSGNAEPTGAGCGDKDNPCTTVDSGFVRLDTSNPCSIIIQKTTTIIGPLEVEWNLTISPPGSDSVDVQVISDPERNVQHAFQFSKGDSSINHLDFRMFDENILSQAVFGISGTEVSLSIESCQFLSLVTYNFIFEQASGNLSITKSNFTGVTKDPQYAPDHGTLVSAQLSQSDSLKLEALRVTSANLVNTQGGFYFGFVVQFEKQTDPSFLFKDITLIEPEESTLGSLHFLVIVGKCGKERMVVDGPVGVSQDGENTENCGYFDNLCQTLYYSVEVAFNTTDPSVAIQGRVDLGYITKLGSKLTIQGRDQNAAVDFSNVNSLSVSGQPAVITINTLEIALTPTFQAEMAVMLSNKASLALNNVKFSISAAEPITFFHSDDSSLSLIDVTMNPPNPQLVNQFLLSLKGQLSIAGSTFNNIQSPSTQQTAPFALVAQSQPSSFSIGSTAARTTFSNFQGAQMGGALFFRIDHDQSSVSIINTAFQNCQATTAGGAVFILYVVEVDPSQLLVSASFSKCSLTDTTANGQWMFVVAPAIEGFVTNDQWKETLKSMDRNNHMQMIWCEAPSMDAPTESISLLDLLMLPVDADEIFVNNGSSFTGTECGSTPATACLTIDLAVSQMKTDASEIVIVGEGRLGKGIGVFGGYFGLRGESSSKTQLKVNGKGYGQTDGMIGGMDSAELSISNLRLTELASSDGLTGLSGSGSWDRKFVSCDCGGHDESNTIQFECISVG
ncbi:hypothetical protein BLNAU_4940 [Blattamonas nauphoetae]|uniref:Uncharacterized protein n=1 Tax=Blattamonas nauphoetae TaxID=2049346 RepID=A0ABQ9Y8G4_9EUKA|nr:hypothetical protein BLNAU_4940 [Blattamonas nauphoetae]